MARPIKEGLDYFPLNITFDDNMELIIAEFGSDGFMIIIKLWQKIYGGKGYYTEWNNDILLLFSKKIGIGKDLVNSVVLRALERDIFNKALYDNYQILTSAGIQRRYLEAKRNNEKRIEKEYFLIDTIKAPINSTKTSVNTEFSTQIKENKNKEYKSKLNHSSRPNNKPSYDLEKIKQIAMQNTDIF